MEIQGYTMPEDLYYDDDHYWIRPEDGLLVMGMDDFAQQMAGEVVYVQLPSEGKTLKAGKKFAKVESGKWVGKINSPVDGELVASNEALETSPGLINSDCYGQGWMYKIRPADEGDISRMIHGAGAVEQWVLESIEKYKMD